MAGGTRRERRDKRKNISGRELNQPESKKHEKSNDSDFTKDLLQSLRNEDIRAAFKSLLNDALVEKIQELEQINQENTDRIIALEADLQRVSQEKSEIASELQDLLQYTRRNALRITNPNWIEPQRPWRPGQPPEDTDALVLALAATLGVPLQPWEIGRSHRVGKPRNDGTPRPILVKFISYNVRHRIYEARKLLKDIPSLARKVYFNEDLTRVNGRLAFEARQMKKQDLLADTFTRDGRIYAKKFTNQKPEVIRDMDHLIAFARAPWYNHHVTSQTRPNDRNSRDGGNNPRANTIRTAARTMASGQVAGRAGTNDETSEGGHMAGDGAMASVASPEVAHPGDTRQTSTPRDDDEVARDESTDDLDATMASESLLPPGGQPESSLLSGITVTNRYAAIETEVQSDQSETY